MSNTGWKGNSAPHCFSENQTDKGPILIYVSVITEALKCGRSCTGSLSFCIYVTHITSSHISVAKENHVAICNVRGVKGNAILPCALKKRDGFINRSISYFYSI